MQRCYGCMKEYSKEYDVCPYCGYIVGTEPEIKSHLFPGTKLADRYILGKTIGHGGFGITYIAWDDKIQKVVAIKEYFPNAFSTRSTGETQISCYNSKAEAFFKEGIKKMLDEAKRLSKFSKNENIVDIYDFFEENNTAYIVMKYLEGKDLKKYLEENNEKLSPEKSVEIILPVINALEDMHKDNLIHRDISPDNIYICDNGKVKLLDFGSARLAVEDSDKSLSVMVKRGYAPKEQYASRSKQGPWTDVYAVCATLYKMITGELPVESMEREDEELKSFSEFGVEGYAELERVVFKGLEINPENRYRDVTSLSLELRQAMNDGPAVPAPRPVTEEKIQNHPTNKPEPKKNNAKIIIAVAAVILIIAAGVVAAVKFLPKKSEKTTTTTQTTQAETTVPVTESAEAIKEKETIEIYEKFLASETLRKTNPAIAAFIEKDFSLLSEKDRDFFDTGSLGINNLASSIIEKEYHDIDNDGTKEMFLSLDLTGAKDSIRLYLVDIDENGNVFIGGEWNNVSPSVGNNHLTVMKDKDGVCYFVAFTNYSSAKTCEKYIYDGKKLTSEFSLEIYNYLLETYEGRCVGYKCTKQNYTLHSPYYSDKEYPDYEQCQKLTYIAASEIWENLFANERITGFGDNSLSTLNTTIKLKDSGTIGSKIKWEFYETGYLMITGSGAIPDYPHPRDAKESEEAPWYKYYYDVKVIDVGEGITKIGELSFYNFVNVENVFLPESLTEIRYGSFASCKKLNYMDIPENVTYIGSYAFEYCENMWHVYLPDGITVISKGMFKDCTSLSSVYIPIGVTTIEADAFNGCMSMEYVYIPNTVTLVEGRAFAYCRELETVYYNGSYTQLTLLRTLYTGTDNNDAFINAEYQYEEDY